MSTVYTFTAENHASQCERYWYSRSHLVKTHLATTITDIDSVQYMAKVSDSSHCTAMYSQICLVSAAERSVLRDVRAAVELVCTGHGLSLLNL